MKKRKIEFKSGDVFIIPLSNQKFVIAQVLDQAMPNTVRIAIYNEVVSSTEEVDMERACRNDGLISLIDVIRTKLSNGAWQVIGNKEINIPISRYPNEQFRANG